MTTTKKTTAVTAEASAEAVTTTVTAEAKSEEAPIVGPVLTAGAQPETVLLSHHLCIDGVDYVPGSTIRVSPDYARRLRAQGYVARS